MLIPNKFSGYGRDGTRVYPISMGSKSAPAPKPTTTITESGPTVTNRTSVNEIPAYLTNASQDLIARGQALTSRPYEAYTGARVAEFSPLMNKAFGRVENQQVAGQLGQATGLAGLASQQALGVGLGAYTPYEMGGFDAQRAQQYMNPYMQSVVDVERRKAQEAADRQSAQLSSQAAKQGAFGGSGAALQQRALTRDTAQQLADIQTQGLGRAYDQGLARFGAEEAMREQSRQYGAGYDLSGQNLRLQGAQTALQGASQLGQLGQQQFAQEMDITQGLGTAGDIQRQREQALMDVKYGDYLTAQKYPYEQLAFQQGLVAGVPYSTTQRTNEVSTPGKQVSQQVETPSTPDPASQVIGAGLTAYGMTGDQSRNNANEPSFAAGGSTGITSLINNVGSLSNDQLSRLQQTQQGPLTLATVAEEVLNRQKMEANAAQQQALNTPPPETTVAAEALAGLSGLPADNLKDMDTTVMAGGGIVAFQAGGDTTRRSGENFADYRRRMFELELQTQRDRNAAVATAREAERQRLLAQRPDGIIPPSPFFDRAALPVSSTPQTPTTPATPATTDSGIANLIKPSATRDAKIRERQGLPAVAPTTKEDVDRGGRNLAAAPAAEAAAPSGLSALDAQLAATNKAKEDAAQANIDRIKKGQEEDGEYGVEREKRLKAQEEGLKGAEDKNLNMAFIQAGLALMQGTTDKGTIANLAAAAGLGVNAYAKGLDKIEAKREKLDDAVARLEELRRTDRQVSRKEINEAEERRDNAATASADALFKWASDKYNMSRDDARFAVTTDLQRKQIAASNRPSSEIQLIERIMAERKVPFTEAAKIASEMGAKPFDPRSVYAKYLTEVNPMMGPPMKYSEFLANFEGTSTPPAGAPVRKQP